MLTLGQGFEIFLYNVVSNGLCLISIHCHWMRKVWVHLLEPFLVTGFTTLKHSNIQLNPKIYHTQIVNIFVIEGCMHVVRQFVT